MLSLGYPYKTFSLYAVSRSWHVQLAILWIATSWLATGLYIAPAVSGVEPKYQALGVNILFGALVFVVAGSLAGQWFGVMQKLGLVENFWFGHQGYEYVELGRLWQILLLTGLVLWLFLMIRALIPALKRKGRKSPFTYAFCYCLISYRILLCSRFDVWTPNPYGYC